MNTNKILWVAIFIVGVLAGWFSHQPNLDMKFGAVGGLLAENYLPFVMYNGGYNSAKDINTSGLLSTTGTFSVGSSGTALSQILKGTCTPIIPLGATLVAASSTFPIDCAVTGVVSGDIVSVSFSTSTASSPTWGATSPNWEILGQKASSTSGYITFTVLNQTGGAANPSSSGIASTTNYMIMR